MSALFASLRCAGGEEDALGRSTVQCDVLEGERRHRWNCTPIRHGSRRAPALLTDALICWNVFELVPKDLERQRGEVRTCRRADELQNLVVNRVNGRCPFDCDRMLCLTGSPELA